MSGARIRPCRRLPLTCHRSCEKRSDLRSQLRVHGVRSTPLRSTHSGTPLAERSDVQEFKYTKCPSPSCSVMSDAPGSKAA